MKKFITLLLSAVLLLAAFAPAAQAATVDAIEPTAIGMWGTIVKVDAANGRLTVRDGKTEQELILLVSEDTKIVDNVKLTPVALKDLRTGTPIYAWHQTVMTASLPPQTGALVMVVNIPADMMAGQYHEVEIVTKSEDAITVLDQPQNLYISIDKEMKIPIFGTDKTLDPADIKPGTKLLAWYDGILTSDPAQTTADALLAFPYDYDGYVSLQNKKVYVNGKAISPNVRTYSKETYVPLKAVAEKMGFKATWNARKRTLTLQKEGITATFVSSKKVFTVNDSDIATSALRTVSGRLFVPYDALRFLGNYKIAQPLKGVAVPN